MFNKLISCEQCCGAGPFLTGSGSRYFFFTGSGSFSYKNRLKSSLKKCFCLHIFTPAPTKKYQLRLAPAPPHWLWNSIRWWIFYGWGSSSLLSQLQLFSLSWSAKKRLEIKIHAYFLTFEEDLCEHSHLVVHRVGLVPERGFRHPPSAVQPDLLRRRYFDFFDP